MRCEEGVGQEHNVGHRDQGKVVAIPKIAFVIVREVRGVGESDQSVLADVDNQIFADAARGIETLFTTEIESDRRLRDLNEGEYLPGCIGAALVIVPRREYRDVGLGLRPAIERKRTLRYDESANAEPLREIMIDDRVSGPMRGSPIGGNSISSPSMSSTRSSGPKIPASAMRW